MQTIDYLRIYSKERALFLSVLRAKEAALYQQFLPLKHSILDVGCGDGFFAHTTFGNKYIDVGLDIETSRIVQVQRGSPYKKIVTYDGYTIPFPNRSFQTVVINSVLEHVDDLQRVLSEIHRVLVPDGTCFATVMAEPWEQNLFGARIFGRWYQTWMRKKQVHTNLLSYHEWSRAFKRAKLTPKETIPYLSARAGAWLDILHYVSLPSLISYTVVKKWVLWPTGWIPMKYFADLMDDEVAKEEAGALFFVLKR